MRRTILLLLSLTMMTGAAWRRGDAYLLHAGKTNVTMTSSQVSIRSVVALQKRLGDGRYLWARIDGREYLIRDEAFLRDAAAMYAPIDALKPEQNALDAEEEELDNRLDAIYDGDAKAEPGELQRLRERNRVVSQRMRELDHQEEALEKVIEAKLRDMVEQAIRDGRAQELP